MVPFLVAPQDHVPVVEQDACFLYRWRCQIRTIPRMRTPTTKIRTQLSADASGLDDDVIKGLASTNQLIKILSGEESSEESSTSESVSAIFVPLYESV